MKNNSGGGLLKKTGIYAIGTFGSKLLTFLLVPVYSFYLNKESFGTYDLVITTINLLVPFVTLQISDSVFRWLITSKDQQERNNAIYGGILVSTIGVVVISTISLLTYLIQPLKGHFWITVLSILSIVYPFLQQVTRGLGFSKVFAFNGVIYTLIFLVFNILFLIIFEMGINSLYFSAIIAYGISCILIVRKIHLASYLKSKTIDRVLIREMIKYSLPLVPNTISWWLINSANKYLILMFLGIQENGIFAMSNRFPVILVMINQVFTLAWQESAITNYNDEKSNSNGKVLENLIKVQFAIVIVLSLASELIVKNFLSSEYLESWYYMPILFLSAAFLSLSSFYGALYLGAKKTKDIFTTTIFSGILNIILGYLLISKFGLFGVAFSTFTGYFFLFINRAYLVQKNRISVFKFPLKTFTLYSILIVITLLIVYKIGGLASIISIPISILILGILNFKSIITLKNTIIKKRKLN